MQSLSRIYLTGFMGSGKTTLGSRLASLLEYEFVDLDDEIVADEGLTISEIFAERGEAGFRLLETRALERTYAKEHVVVAVGGGALADKKQMLKALRLGIVVYLSAGESMLWERLRSSEAVRPLLQNRRDFRRLLKKREPVYQMAHIVVEVDGTKIDDAGMALKQAIESYRSLGPSE